MPVKDTDLAAIDWLALTLVVVGALNWGLIGLGGYVDVYGNVVNVFFGVVGLVLADTAFLEHGLYLLIGLAGVRTAYLVFWR